MGTLSDDPDLIAAFVEEAGELLQELEGCLLALEAGPFDTELINRSFRCAHTVKGNSAMLALDHVAEMAHAMESVLGRLRERRLPCEAGTIGPLLAAGDALRRCLATDRGAPAPPERGRLLNELRRLERSDGDLSAPMASPGLAAPSDAAGAGRIGPAFDDQGSLRVAVGKVDKVVDLTGELAITQSMVAQLIAQLDLDTRAQLREAVADMERKARELQQRVLSIRMLPLRSIFARFPRIVRDLAAECGKRVAMEITGEETEVDRSMIEQIADPLVHLIRNAVDHGIEHPAIRAERGKPAQGTIRLEAQQRGGRIFIDVGDDGQGLDRPRILRKAVERGLLAADAVPSDGEVWSMIFEPGFSTAERVTNISGRGVGMDVVRRNVLAVGGSIAVDSEAGAGTRFRIGLPLTLAILDAQLLRVGTQVYAIPLASIVESLRPRVGEVRTVLGHGDVLTVHGEVLPILSLHKLLGVAPAAVDPGSRLLVVVEGDRGKLAILVDQLLEQQQVVIKSLETNFRRVPGIAAATILGDGRVALIVDVPGLIEMAWPTAQCTAVPTSPEREAACRPNGPGGVPRCSLPSQT
jgi:two-component system chemotaxis sensor kinase CheA